MNLLLHAGNQDIDYVVLDLGEHLLVLVEFVVLGRNHDGVDSLGDALVRVLHRHLTLGIGAQVGHLLALLADIGQGAHDQVSQVEADGHKVLRLVRGVAEHHALVTSTLLVLVAVVDTAVDVGTLLVNGTQDTTRVTVELILGLRVADALDGIAGDGLQVDIHVAAHLSHNNYLSCRHERFTSHAGLVVVSQELV